MAREYAMVNKNTLAFLHEKTHVSFEYLEKATGKRPKHQRSKSVVVA